MGGTVATLVPQDHDLGVSECCTHTVVSACKPWNFEAAFSRCSLQDCWECRRCLHAASR